MNIIDQLVDAAYDTGYYSRSGSPYARTQLSKATLVREKLRHELLDLTRGQEKTIADLRAQIAGLEEDAGL